VEEVTFLAPNGIHVVIALKKKPALVIIKFPKNFYPKSFHPYYIQLYLTDRKAQDILVSIEIVLINSDIESATITQSFGGIGVRNLFDIESIFYHENSDILVVADEAKVRKNNGKKVEEFSLALFSSSGSFAWRIMCDLDEEPESLAVMEYRSTKEHFFVAGDMFNMNTVEMVGKCREKDTSDTNGIVAVPPGSIGKPF